MKKRLLPLILAAFTLVTVSCSTDNSNVPAENSAASAMQAKSLNASDLETAKRLYADMVITQEYLDLISAVKAFNGKFAGNNVVLASKSEWMTWVTANLSSTSFTSVTEFETMFDDAAHKMDVVKAANTTFYTLLEQADTTQTMLILNPFESTPEYPIASNDCTDDCITACELELDASDAQYIYEMAYVSFADDEIRGLLQTVVRDLYNERFEQIVRNLNDCVGAC